MRIVVTGTTGQLVRSLIALGERDSGPVILPVGRPALDLLKPQTVAASLAALKPDVIVNAAAYTAVDLAETNRDDADAINGAGAGYVATAARQLGVPVVQISTDYVFDGSKTTAYTEDDPVCPVNAYGASKLKGEEAVRAATDNHAILRTSWVYAASGKNFVATMLRLAETRDVVQVVNDQFGAPTYAPDLAEAVVQVARNLIARPDDAALRGVFHATGAGRTSWAGFAAEIFRLAAAPAGRGTQVEPIPTSAYPTPARRPANSQLSGDKLKKVHGILLPHWQDALSRCINAIEHSREAGA